ARHRRGPDGGPDRILVRGETDTHLSVFVPVSTDAVSSTPSGKCRADANRKSAEDKETCKERLTGECHFVKTVTQSLTLNDSVSTASRTLSGADRSSGARCRAPSPRPPCRPCKMPGPSGSAPFRPRRAVGWRRSSGRPATPGRRGGWAGRGG